MKVYIFLVASIACLAALGQKKLIKQASVLESAGQFEQAAEKYQEVLHKNPTRIEAIDGLKRTSQKVVDKGLSNFFIAKNSKEHEKAIKVFEEVLYYQKELDYFNISVDIPSYYYEDYEAEKSGLKTKQDASRNLQISNTYNRAVKSFENEEWIKAWELLAKTQGFKETSSYQKAIEEKATRISIVSNSKNQFSSEERFRGTLLVEIIKRKNPLIKVINRDNLDQLITEQKLGLSGLWDEQSVASLGKILGVEMMLLTRILNLEFVEGDKEIQNKTAYAASVRKVYDPTTQTTNSVKDYHPVVYQEHHQPGSYRISLQYQLIDVSTAEIVDADVIYETYNSEIFYATYTGDPYTLFPSDGSSIYTKGEERNAFLSLFNSESQSTSKKQMEIEAQKKLSEKVAHSVDNYFKK